jgi:hypothetical protein
MSYQWFATYEDAPFDREGGWAWQMNPTMFRQRVSSTCRQPIIGRGQLALDRTVTGTAGLSKSS